MPLINHSNHVAPGAAQRCLPGLVGSITGKFSICGNGQRLKIVCDATASGFQPGFFQGPHPEKGLRIVSGKQPGRFL